MRRIESKLDIASEEFRLNRAHNHGLADALKERHRVARRERPARDLERLSRQNKMFVRDRIELLLDPGTPFLELLSLIHISPRCAACWSVGAPVTLAWRCWHSTRRIQGASDE